MDIHASPQAPVTTQPRLYGIVQSYIQKQLPRDIHPAFKALRDRQEAASTSPQIIVTGDTTSPSQAERGSRIDQIGTEEDEGDLPLYATSQDPLLLPD